MQKKVSELQHTQRNIKCFSKTWMQTEKVKLVSRKNNSNSSIPIHFSQLIIASLISSPYLTPPHLLKRNPMIWIFRGKFKKQISPRQTTKGLIWFVVSIWQIQNIYCKNYVFYISYDCLDIYIDKVLNKFNSMIACFYPTMG